MIGLDTNVLIRILVDDTGEMAQVEQARKAVSQHEEVLISQTLQIETIWVLKRAYGLSKAELIRVLEHLQNNRGFVLENFEVFNDVLGGCPRIEVVARERGFEAIFSIKGGEYWAYLTSLIGKMDQNPLFRSRLSILGQPPSALPKLKRKLFGFCYSGL